MAKPAQRIWTPPEDPTAKKLGWRRCGLDMKADAAIDESDMALARGIIYEPRAFWSVATVNTETADNTNFLLNREHFHNGSRYPITLNRLIVAPLSYTFREYGAEPPIDETQFHNSNAIINLMQVMVSAPFRQHYSRKTFNTSGFGPLSTAEPVMRNDPTIPYASGLWGVVHWDFDKGLLLPRLGSIEFSMTGYTFPNIPGVSVPSSENRPVFTSIMWHEFGTFMNGSGRLRDREYLPDIDIPTAAEDIGWLQGDAFGAIAPANVTPAWTPAGTMTAHDFNQRNPVRTGSALIRGLSVHIDQLLYDDNIDAVGAFNNQEITPLAMRIACRARMVGCGTQEWWWRPGAPLAMVMPTITPAQVFPLDPPITLGPGDTLDVEVRTPSSVSAIGSPPQTMTPTYRFGVSLTGWAAIEG